MDSEERRKEELKTSQNEMIDYYSQKNSYHFYVNALFVANKLDKNQKFVVESEDGQRRKEERKKKIEEF